MTIEEKLFSVLTADAGVAALVGTRVYPVEAPDRPTAPHIVYALIDREPIRTHNAFGGSSGHIRKVTMRVSGLAKTYRQAKAVAEAILAAIDGYVEEAVINIFLEGEHGHVFYPDTRDYEYVMTFVVLANL